MISKRLFLMLIVAVYSFGCSRHTNRSSGPEVLLNSTEVGVPNGPPANKEIGPAGGSLASADGRLTVTVPINAVSASVAFSIQPITNQAFGGLGNAYRLEPSGMTFTTPLELSIHFDDNDLKGTIPESLALAYQDEKGSWRALEAGKLDRDRKTLTVSATHFTDWSFLARMHLRPAESDVFVNETVYLNLMQCKPPFNTFSSWFFKESSKCGAVPTNQLDWYVNGIRSGNSTFGTIIPHQQDTGAFFKAPAKKPNPSTVTVALPYYYSIGTETRSGTWTALIRIHSAQYIASGFDGPVVYSSVICDLAQDFIITGRHPMGDMSYRFRPSPSSLATGDMVYAAIMSSGMGPKIRTEGSGSYQIEGADTDTPVIVVQVKSTATLANTTSGGGEARIKLTRLKTIDDKCKQP